MGATVELRAGCATTVGPVPGTDVEEGVEFALSADSDLLTVPVFGSGPGSLLAQAVAGFSGVEVVPPGLLRVDSHAFDPRAVPAGVRAADASELVAGPSFSAFHAFLERVGAAGSCGVRIPVLGPVTLSLALRAAGVSSDDALHLAAEVVGRRAVALLRAARRSHGDGVAVVCATEPGLIGAMHPTFPLSPSDVLELLGSFVATVDRHAGDEPLLIGVHVPGRTDWETIVASGVSLISAPADAGIVGWAEVIGSFLDDGGRVAWGAVPVDQPLGTSEELLWRRLSGVWCELVGEGLDPLALRDRCLISPVDGLGHFGSSQARRVVELVGSLATRVGRQALGARLSLGA